MWQRCFVFPLLVFLLLPTRAVVGERELVFGLPPYAKPTATYQAFLPLDQHLSDLLLREVGISVAPNYISHITRLGRDELDLAF